MKIRKLYDRLVEAYSDTNLNRITGNLILLYKNKNLDKIRELANRISRYVPISDEKDAKCFSRLIMLYHPDKGEQTRSAIQKLHTENNFEELEKYTHIFLVEDTDITITAKVDEDVDYNPAYAWDITQRDGFDYSDEETNTEVEETDVERSFYNMIKIREYGRVDIEFPSYYLEDFEEYEMSYCGLESLDGVQYCIHAKILDFSDNQISDIENLWDLTALEELYLAGNQIGYIDAMSNLTNLKVLDISENLIDDITPLLGLPQLEYVNLIGNKIPSKQIALLEKEGIVVLS